MIKLNKSPFLKKGEYYKIETLSAFKCNCNCIMCSLANLMKNKMSKERPFKEIKKEIDYARKAGAEIFSFSGGEPTLRRDLIGLIKYAKKRIPKVEIQSNGRMFYYKNYCKKLIQAGVDIFTISIFSPFKEIHDKIVGVKCAYKETLKGLKNLKELDQEIRINIVILKLNYKHLPKLVKFLLKFNIKQFRFIYPTLEGNALKNIKTTIVKMSIVSSYLKDALKIGLEKSSCYVYNMTPCVLQDYEGTINDIAQSSTLIIGGDNFKCDIDKTRKKVKVKFNKCKRCSYNFCCYGVWKNYAQFFGLKELKPVKLQPNERFLGWIKNNSFFKGILDIKLKDIFPYTKDRRKNFLMRAKYDSKRYLERIDYYKRNIKQKRYLPPVIVWKNPKNKYCLIDGFCRYMAFRELGIKTIKCVLMKPNQKNAIQLV
jgi:MoaA/NifB/PqqE/SkfB family radical SAM enzyme